MRGSHRGCLLHGRTTSVTAQEHTVRASHAITIAATALALTGCSIPTTTPNPAPTAPAGKLDSLTTEPENASSDYDRDDYPHWEQIGPTHTIPDNCDAREARMLMHGNQVRVDNACEPTQGTFTGAYTDTVIHDDSEVDMDHLVPLAEAHRSGAWQWHHQRREEFANDIGQLRISTQSANREKGDKDPADWLPPENRCQYVHSWISVKVKYELTVDRAERAALEDVLSRC